MGKKVFDFRSLGNVKLKMEKVPLKGFETMKNKSKPFMISMHKHEKSFVCPHCNTRMAFKMKK